MYALELAGEDDRFAAAEAASAATGIEVVAPGLATATAVTDRVRNLAYTHRVSELVGETDASVESARVLLEASAPNPEESASNADESASDAEESASNPEESASDREGTVSVRARDVRDTAEIDTQRAERVLGQVLVDRGYEVDLDDPDHVLRAIFSDDTCVLGWLRAESVRDFGTRKPTDRPFFQPGGMDPLLARALVNLARARPGATLLDPMCGTGGVLIEAGLVGATVLGADAQRKMARGAAENLAHYLDADERATGEWATLQGDATHLPFPDKVSEDPSESGDTESRKSIDAVVFDAPYGRQSKIANLDLDDLVSGALSESRRVADRAVVVGDRSWSGEAREVGWTVEAEFERRVHRSLDRHVVVLDGSGADESARL